MEPKEKKGEGAWSSEGMAIDGDPLFQDDMNDLAEETMSKEWLAMQEELKGQIDSADEGSTKED